MAEPIKILIVEDHNLVARLLSASLEAVDDFKVVKIVDNGQKALELIEDFECDVILLDIDMPVLDGIQTLTEIKKRNKIVKSIMISNHNEAWLIKKALNKGADGYITKFADSEELINAIYSVMNNQVYLCEISKKQVNFFNDLESHIKTQYNNKGEEGCEINNEPFTVRYQRLTKREKQILELIIKDASNKEISEILYISYRTVETHRRNIIKKMEYKNTLSMVKDAIESCLFFK